MYKSTNPAFKEDLIRKSRNVKGLIDNEGCITIYRVESNKSNSINEAYSWATDINFALSFATRFDISGRLYTAKIKAKDVVDILNIRRGSEVLVLPENLINPILMDEYSWSELEDRLVDCGIICLYKKFAHCRLEPGFFIDPKSIHGMLHTKRVLLLSLIIGYFENLGDDDLKILSFAAMYHDIGRTDNEICDDHGKDSYKKAVSLGLINVVDTDEHKILKFIIEGHSIDDKKAINELLPYNFNCKDRAIKLFNILKDADALDRARLEEINIDFLRLKISSKLLLLAYQLIEGVK